MAPYARPAEVGCGDRLERLLVEKILHDWQFHHPVFDYLERTACEEEVRHFVARGRPWSTHDGESADPAAAALMFPELLDRLSRDRPAAGAPSRLDPAPKAALLRRAREIVESLADAYQYQKLLTASLRVGLAAAAPAGPPPNMRPRRPVTRWLEARDAGGGDLVPCIKACLAERVDHYDDVLAEMMSLPVAC